MPKTIAAFDLGTSRCAYAFSIEGRAQDSILVHTPKGSGSCPSTLKTSTAILLKGLYPYDLVALGRAAVLRYVREVHGEKDSDDDDDGDDSGFVIPNVVPNMLFRNFKTVLCERRGYTSVDEPIATAEGGQTLPLMTVVTAALRNWKVDTLAFLASRLEVAPSVEDVTWVVTIPAIYDDFAKRLMRVAANKAGITSVVDDFSRFHLCLEPEAACLAVSIQDAPLLMQPGTKIMVLDCGGGTVDITTHVVKSRHPLSLSELRKPDGGAWGSTYVDKKFEAFLRKLLGEDAFDLVRHTSAFCKLMDEFEEEKTKFLQDEESDSIQLNLVDIAGHLGIDDRRLKELRVAHNRDLEVTLHVSGRKYLITLPEHLVRSFFAESITQIATCLRDLKKDPALRGLNYVFLVGGFSSSPLVQKTARAEMESDGCAVIVGLYPELAIVKGAVLSANHPSAITSRKARLTYGVKSTIKFDPDDPEHLVRRSRTPIFDDKGEEVIDSFSSHIKVDEDIPIGGICPRRSYGPLLPHQSQVSFQILASHMADIKFPDKDSTFPLGEITVDLDMRETFEKRGIEAEFIFGGTEFKMECFRKATGEKVDEVMLSLVQEVQESV